jgi:hypothetical protein
MTHHFAFKDSGKEFDLYLTEDNEWVLVWMVEDRPFNNKPRPYGAYLPFRTNGSVDWAASRVPQEFSDESKCKVESIIARLNKIRLFL